MPMTRAEVDLLKVFIAVMLYPLQRIKFSFWEFSDWRIKAQVWRSNGLRKRHKNKEFRLTPTEMTPSLSVLFGSYNPQD